MIFDVGRVCMKIAGRDAGKKCVVVESLDNTYVLVDGATRRKKVNIKHLEPLSETLEIEAKASHEDVKKAFESLGVKVLETKAKKAAERPKKVKKKKVKPVKEKKAKKESKSEAVAKEEKSVEKAEEPETVVKKEDKLAEKAEKKVEAVKAEKSQGSKE